MTYLKPTRSITKVESVYKLYFIHLSLLFLIYLLSIINFKFLNFPVNNKKETVYQKTISFQIHAVF